MTRHVNRLLLVCGTVVFLWAGWMVCSAALAEECSCGCAVVSQQYIGLDEDLCKWYQTSQNLAFDDFFDSASDPDKHATNMKSRSPLDLSECDDDVTCKNTDDTCQFPCSASCPGCRSTFGSSESVGQECTADQS